ncbi:MAG: hypothetical protein WCV90_04745 [Candidatus Woesearchaeota archaeon]|jgi:hypothetical protein
MNFAGFPEYDVVLELLFGIISLVLSLFAFRVYKRTSQRQTKLFGIAFMFMSLSYFTQSLFNFLIISTAKGAVCKAAYVPIFNWYNFLGVYTHIILMTIGLVVLTYMTLKVQKPMLLWMMLLISLTALFFSEEHFFTVFLILSTIYFIFISIHFVNNYRKNRDRKSLVIALAFLFLLFGSINFIFCDQAELFYLIAHLLALIAYLFILWDFYLVLKK